jgi:thiol:disulfide interchange protein DsbC
MNKQQLLKLMPVALLAGSLVLAAGLLVLWRANDREAVIRKNLGERLPKLQPIDEVSSSPMAGLYEVRVNGSDIYYTDAQGNYLIHGDLVDTQRRHNLTEERVEKLTAIDFGALPLGDAITFVKGNGERKLAVFEDPNCGYCRRFEGDLQTIDNVTIHLFLYPILGPDSAEKSAHIWCAKDQGKSWLDWMLHDTPPVAAECDAAAVGRNVAFGHQYKITGTPTLVFANGVRVPGALAAAQVEKLLAESN